MLFIRFCQQVTEKYPKKDTKLLIGCHLGGRSVKVSIDSFAYFRALGVLYIPRLCFGLRNIHMLLWPSV